MNSKNHSILLSEIKNLFSNYGFVILTYLLMLYTISDSDFHVYLKVVVCVLALTLVARYIDRVAIIILAFSFTYTLIGYVEGSSKSHFESFTYLLGPITFYCIGRHVVNKSNSTDEIATFFLLQTILSSFVLWKTNIIDGLQNGLINISRAVLFDGVEFTATGQGLIASIGLSCIAYVVAKGKMHGVKSILFFVCFILSLYCVVHLTNRTGLLVIAFTILVTILYVSRGNIKNIIYIIILLIGLYYILVYTGFINEEVFEVYESRNNADFSSAASAGGRIEIWEESILYFAQFPFGWHNVPNTPYAHNLWLDIARCTGWLPFFLFIIITFKCINTLLKLYRKRGDWFIGFLIGLNGCFLLSSFVEPVVELSSTYFYLIFLIWGIQQQYYCQIKNDIL